MTKEEFVSYVKKLNLNIDDNILAKLDIYYSYLVSENNKYNLTTITTEDQVYLKHFYDSLTLCSKIKFNDGDSLLDIGSGAGFPGLVLKIFNPGLKVILIDSSNKKVNFLNNLIGILKLDNIKAVCCRSEEYAKEHSGQFDYVTARAVAPLNILIELAIPLLKINGSFIAMKAKKNENELEDGIFASGVLGSKLEFVDEFLLPIENSERTIFKFIKITKTPSIYPRDYSKIIKNPLIKSSK